MLSARYNTLVGEGCPIPNLQEPAKNRNNYCGRLAGSRSLSPERDRNLQRKKHRFDTRNRKTVRHPFRAEKGKIRMTPLPTLDISTPEAATKTLREFEAWLWREQSLSADQRYVEIRYQANYVRAGIDMMRFKNAHISPAAKQLVQEAIDKLREMLTAGKRENE